MAVRFDAAADRLLRTTDLLDYNAAYSWMAWIQIVVDLNANSTFFMLNDDTANNYDHIRTLADGTQLRLTTTIGGAAQSVSGSVLTVGQWYHLAMIRESANSIKIYLDGVLDITGNQNIAGRAAVTRMEHAGRSSSNIEPSNSRVAAIKAWSTNISLAQLQNEMRVIRPIRTSNLYGFWPCFPGSTERLRDYSGNGRNWTESGTLTDEDPPPVSWGAQSFYIVEQFGPVASGWGQLLSDRRNRLVVT